MNGHYLFPSECLEQWDQKVRNIADSVAIFGRDEVRNESLNEIFGHDYNFTDGKFAGGGVITSGDAAVVLLILNQTVGEFELHAGERLVLLADTPPKSVWRRKEVGSLYEKVEKRLIEIGASRVNIKTGSKLS